VAGALLGDDSAPNDQVKEDIYYPLFSYFHHIRGFHPKGEAESSR